MTPLFGYVAGPRLLDTTVLAEQAGFDAVWASDHFHPW
jgi:alkanesulfonate monooxygenase SsuD/methylene tetrahydromethanopterin reductase-like flavin-dependent oxidoreductase (luciferase family)